MPIQDYERLIADDLESEEAESLAVSTAEARARARLRSFLAEPQSRIPAISDDEIDKDIQEAIQAIRHEV